MAIVVVVAAAVVVVDTVAVLTGSIVEVVEDVGVVA